MRIGKFLSYCGITSRRKTKDLILSGRVKVNGKVVRDLSFQVDPEKHEVTVDGKLVTPPPKVYYLFYKPKGYITSLYDPYGKKNIREFLEKLPYRVFPVGRLDRESEGLLLLTNDGDLANYLLHPRYEVKRIYKVWVTPCLSKKRIEKLLEKGVIVGEKLIKPLEFKLIKKEKDKWIYKVVVKEGVKREVRKMVGSLGGRVHKLLRIQFGPLKLKNLKPGEIRPLNLNELEELFNFVNQLKNSRTFSSTSSGDET